MATYIELQDDIIVDRSRSCCDEDQTDPPQIHRSILGFYKNRNFRTRNSKVCFFSPRASSDCL